jgi:hypothetical protein
MGTFVGIISAVLLLVCLLFSGSRCFAQTPPSAAPAGSGEPPPAVSTEAVKSLDRGEIRGMLKKLADTPPPKQGKVSFAMCYSTVPPPTRADYICPKCGERTVYDAGEKTSPLERAEHGTVEVVNWGIKVCRRDVEQLRKVVGGAISLDESQFCRKCSPKASSPKLLLRIAYKDGKSRDIENITHDDLRILHDFFAGRLLTKDDRDFESPLKDRLPRLQELLGVKLEK